MSTAHMYANIHLYTYMCAHKYLLRVSIDKDVSTYTRTHTHSVQITILFFFKIDHI